jgi:hypothetical protein
LLPDHIPRRPCTAPNTHLERSSLEEIYAGLFCGLSSMS